MRRVSTTVPAPADLGVAMARIPEGSDVGLDLRLESVVEGVLVTGTARVRVAGECARCLDPVAWDDEVDLTELFAYPATDARGAVVDDGDVDQDDPLPTLEGDPLDLEPTLRDAVVLALPLAPVCRETCLGLCPDCGARLADDPTHQHDQVDPRWAALTALTRGTEHLGPDEPKED